MRTFFMKLPEAYKLIAPSVVAFVPKYLSVQEGVTPPTFPPIFGTGFIVREDGLIATNDHVMRVFAKVIKPQNAANTDWGVEAILFRMTPRGMVTAHLEVLGVFGVADFIPGKIYYGEKKLDVAYVRVRAKGLPAVLIDSETQIEEGCEIGTSGFPMGTSHILGGSGAVAQVGPTLQRGIISGVVPFSCKAPNGYVINVMVQGGASGSPVFDSSTGRVIGILHSRRIEPDETGTGWRPTNFSLVLPSHYIVSGLKGIGEKSIPALPADAKTIDDMMTDAKVGQELTWTDVDPPEIPKPPGEMGGA